MSRGWCGSLLGGERILLGRRESCHPELVVFASTLQIGSLDARYQTRRESDCGLELGRLDDGEGLHFPGCSPARKGSDGDQQLVISPRRSCSYVWTLAGRSGSALSGRRERAAVRLVRLPPSWKKGDEVVVVGDRVGRMLRLPGDMRVLICLLTISEIRSFPDGMTGVIYISFRPLLANRHRAP